MTVAAQNERLACSVSYDVRSKSYWPHLAPGRVSTACTGPTAVNSKVITITAAAALLVDNLRKLLRISVSSL